MPKQIKERVWKRGNVYWCWYYLETKGKGGAVERKRVRESTGKTSRDAALEYLRQRERRASLTASNPHHEAQGSATLKQALDLLIAKRNAQATAKEATRSKETVKFYTRKAGNLIAYFGKGFLLADVTGPDVVEAYVTARMPHVKRHTIHKEIVTWRGAMKCAKRAHLWEGDIDAIFVDEDGEAFTTGYKPRMTALRNMGELQRLLSAIVEPTQEAKSERGERAEAKARLARLDHAAVVAFMVATSAESSTLAKVKRSEVSAEAKVVPVHGTKRETRDRLVGIVTPWQRQLLTYAAKHGSGAGALLFRPWANARRDLNTACDRAGLPHHLSPNDLRRTFGQWMVEAGFLLSDIAPMMGHGDTRMLERVYGRIDNERRAEKMREQWRVLQGGKRRAKATALPTKTADTGTGKNKTRGAV